MTLQPVVGGSSVLARGKRRLQPTETFTISSPCPAAPACCVTYRFSARRPPRPYSGCELCCSEPLQLGLNQHRRTKLLSYLHLGRSATGCNLRKSHSSVKRLTDDVSRYSQVTHCLICHQKTSAGGPPSKQSILPSTLWSVGKAGDVLAILRFYY